MNEFWDLAEYLKQGVPLNQFPLALRVVDMKDFGSTSISDRGLITICVRKTDPVSVKIHTLLHEWGHAYEYDLLGLHGKHWATGHSKAYQAWERWQRGE